jgi:hypothetical protein
MPQHVTLSNGHKLDIPDGLTNDQITDRVNQMESLINPQWKGFGNLSNATETVRNIMSYVTNPAERIAAAGLNLNPVIGGVDLGVGGVNAAKSVASKWYPSLKNTPDIPTISGLVSDVAGVPPLDPNSSAVQRYAEAVATGVLNPGKSLPTALRMLTSTGGGDIGGWLAEHYGGPEFEKLGRWLGSLMGGSPDVLKGPATNTARWMFAGPQAGRVDQSAQGVGVRPSFGVLANTPGRYLTKALAAVPFAGNPSLEAQGRIEQATEDARTRAAEQINQGPLPAHSDPNSIGENMISLARTRSAAIKAAAKQKFADLYQKVGPDTLVDARPVIAEIQNQMARPDISADQIQGLQARLDYLMSMTHGQQYYRGQTLGGTLSPTMTLGQLGQFRTELGEDLVNMPAINTVFEGPVRDAITNSMQSLMNQRGYGQEFQNANDNYRNNIGPGTPTEALDAVGGKPIPGKPGLYNGGMSEQQAYSFLKRNTQSPSKLEPFVDPNNPYWRATAAQFINSLGDTDQGGFRADTYSKGAGKISDPVLTQLTQAPTGQGGGGPLQPATSLIRQAQDVGENSSVAVSRHGLTGAVGSSAALWWLANHVGEALSTMSVPRDLAIPASIYLLSKGLESKTMTDAMAGRATATPLVDALYAGYPTAATSLSLNNPDDPRLGYSVTQRPPSPLDQLNQPPQ